MLFQDSPDSSIMLSMTHIASGETFASRFLCVGGPAQQVWHDIRTAARLVSTPTGMCTSQAYGLFWKYYGRDPYGNMELYGFLKDLGGVNSDTRPYPPKADADSDHVGAVERVTRPVSFLKEVA